MVVDFRAGLTGWQIMWWVSPVLPDAVVASLTAQAAKAPPASAAELLQQATPQALADEVAALRALLADLSPGVTALNAQAQALAARRARREAALAAETLQASISASGPGVTMPVECTAHLDCQSCLNNRCGWCLGERACVKDEPWMCQGQEDHVGSIGQHKQCPDPHEFETRRARRDAEEALEMADHARVAKEMEAAAAAGGDAGAGGALTQDITCVMWRQTSGCMPDGPAEHAKDLPCSYPVPSGNSGYCECSGGLHVAKSTCEHDSFTCAEKCGSYTSMRREAAERAKEKLKKRTAAELARLRTVMETEQSKLCAPEEDPETDGCRVPAGSDEAERAAAAARSADIRKRVNEAKNLNGGEVRPYETLGVAKDASQTEIRRAYRKLALELHPDKNPTMLVESQMAFADVVAAFEILNNPDKRAAFDDGGARQGFQTQWEYEQFGKQDTRGFYTNDNYITSMTERIWEKRVNTNQIWYASGLFSFSRAQHLPSSLPLCIPGCSSFTRRGASIAFNWPPPTRRWPRA